MIYDALLMKNTNYDHDYDTDIKGGGCIYGHDTDILHIYDD